MSKPLKEGRASAVKKRYKPSKSSSKSQKTQKRVHFQTNSPSQPRLPPPPPPLDAMLLPSNSGIRPIAPVQPLSLPLWIKSEPTMHAPSDLSAMIDDLASSNRPIFIDAPPSLARITEETRPGTKRSSYLKHCQMTETQAKNRRRGQNRQSARRTRLQTKRHIAVLENRYEEARDKYEELLAKYKDVAGEAADIPKFRADNADLIAEIDEELDGENSPQKFENSEPVCVKSVFKVEKKESQKREKNESARLRDVVDGHEAKIAALEKQLADERAHNQTMSRNFQCFSTEMKAPPFQARQADVPLDIMDNPLKFPLAPLVPELNMNRNNFGTENYDVEMDESVPPTPQLFQIPRLESQQPAQAAFGALSTSPAGNTFDAGYGNIFDDIAQSSLFSLGNTAFSTNEFARADYLGGPDLPYGFGSSGFDGVGSFFGDVTANSAFVSGVGNSGGVRF